MARPPFQRTLESTTTYRDGVFLVVKMRVCHDQYLLYGLRLVSSEWAAHRLQPEEYRQALCSTDSVVLRHSCSKLLASDAHIDFNVTTNHTEVHPCILRPLVEPCHQFPTALCRSCRRMARMCVPRLAATPSSLYPPPSSAAQPCLPGLSARITARGGGGGREGVEATSDGTCVVASLAWCWRLVWSAGVILR